MLCVLVARRGRLPEAIADMKEAVRCAPNAPRWFVRLGEMAARAGELEVARASYESALRLSPEDANYGEATVLAQEKQPERGLAMITAAIGLHPDSASLYFARGRLELDRDLWANAARDFGEAIRLRPNFAMAYSNRGIAEVGLRVLRAAGSGLPREGTSKESAAISRGFGEMDWFSASP